MAEVKWIKIVTDIFSNRKIKQIEAMPDADSILVIWFKILCLAGNVNENGLIMITKDIPYTDEMLANEFKKPINTIRMALQLFEKFKMIELNNNIYCVSNWEKYQNVDTLEKIREQTRLRVAKYKQKQKQLTDGNVKVTLAVTHGNASDKELDIDIDKEIKDICEETSPSIPYQTIVEYLNEKAGTKYKYTSKGTKDLIKARWNEKYTMDDFKTVIDKKAAEWLKTDQEKYLRPETLFAAKHFESYLNQKNNSGNGNKPSNNGNFQQRQYDDSYFESLYENIEKE